MTSTAHAHVSKLTPEVINNLALEAAAAIGRPTRGTELIKFTNNAVVRLRKVGLVVRIAGSTVMRTRLPGVIAAARLFEEHHVPAVRLWPGEQPLHVRDHLATIWVEAEPSHASAHPDELARLVKQVHQLPPPYPQEIPAWSLTAGLRQRISDGTDMAPETIAYLSAELDDVQRDLATLSAIPPLLPPGLIHGDAHTGNVITTCSGPILCDFDSTSYGPREWDLTPAAVGTLRFRYSPDVHQSMVVHHEVDVTEWPGFPVLRRLRELQLIISVIPALSVNPGLLPQWRHRLSTYRNGDHEAIWTPYDQSHRRDPLTP